MLFFLILSLYAPTRRRRRKTSALGYRITETPIKMVRTQRPTLQNIRIRSTLDAHKIFYSVYQGHLEMVTRRLDADERMALGSGCVYAWEERGPHTEITGLGIERFTEGRRWSPSRVRDVRLFHSFSINDIWITVFGFRFLGFLLPPLFTSIFCSFYCLL